MNINEILESKKLNYLVKERAVQTLDGRVIETHKALFNGDNLLSVVGIDYQVIQNESAFKAFDQLIQPFSPDYHNAFILKSGTRAIIQAQLSESYWFQPVQGDYVSLYATFINSHDGSCSLRALLTPVRLFCMNQLHKAIKGAFIDVKIRHTSGLLERLKSNMRGSLDSYILFKDRCTLLGNQKVCTKQVDTYLKTLFPKKTNYYESIRNRIEDLFLNGKGNRGESAWQLYNAVIEYIDYNPKIDLNSRFFGNGSTLKERAFKEICAI